ncbi:MAG: hypothetical protein JRJ39_07840 [Deltaproteobacteria bacterium]|nr:hypothetical protein [Deltaproteobacteria bacterium]
MQDYGNVAYRAAKKVSNVIKTLNSRQFFIKNDTNGSLLIFKNKVAKMLKVFLTLVAVCLLLPGTACAIMPPDDIAKLNLKAELILIGEVKGTGKILLPEKGKDARKGVFILKVSHVVKGYSKVKQNEEIHVIYRLPPEPAKGLTANRAGSLQVKVEKGNLVVVYLNPSTHSGFYTPITEGSSVVVILSTGKEQSQNNDKTKK